MAQPRWLDTVFYTVRKKYFSSHRFETEMRPKSANEELKQNSVLVIATVETIGEEKEAMDLLLAA